MTLGEWKQNIKGDWYQQSGQSNANQKILFPPELIKFSRRIPQLEATIIFSVIHSMEGGYRPIIIPDFTKNLDSPKPIGKKIQPGRSLKMVWLARLSR